MRIERINENSIRCTLTSFDLSVRDLNIRELAYGTDKVRKLFNEMMTRASSEVGFESDGTPLMIEAIPMSSDSIQLVITKVTDPEELDTRFSRFSPGIQNQKNPKNNAEDWLHRLTSELLEGATGFIQQVQNMQAGSQQKNAALKKAPEKKPEESMPVQTLRAVGFNDLDTVFDAAAAAGFFRGESRLYRKPDGSRYVFLLKGTEENFEIFSKACNVLTEYGYSIRTTDGTKAYYDEHYELIIDTPAIEKICGTKGK